MGAKGSVISTLRSNSCVISAKMATALFTSEEEVVNHVKAVVGKNKNNNKIIKNIHNNNNNNDNSRRIVKPKKFEDATPQVPRKLIKNSDNNMGNPLSI